MKENTTFNIIAHSLGTCIASEIAHLLEKEGLIGKLLLIDGSSEYIKEYLKANFAQNLEIFETELLSYIMELFLAKNELETFRKQLRSTEGLTEKIALSTKFIPKVPNFSKEFLENYALAIIARVKGLLFYEKSFTKIQSCVKLVKSKTQIIKNFDEDYKLRSYCADFAGFTVVDGDHMSMLDNKNLAMEINEFFDN